MISFSSSLISIISVSSEMFRKLKSNVPLIWVLVVILTSSDNCLQAFQFWTTEPPLIHDLVILVSDSANQFFPVDQCTVLKQSWKEVDKMAPNLTVEQNQVLKNVYKLGRKSIHLQSHVNFLNECLELDFIPKHFNIKNNLPGSKVEIQKQLDLASVISMKCEKVTHEENLNTIVTEFEQSKEHLKTVFSPAATIEELLRLERHLVKVEKTKKKVLLKKMRRNYNPNINAPNVDEDVLNVANLSDVTLVSDDDIPVDAHKCSTDLDESSDVTIADDDDANLAAHISNNLDEELVVNVSSSDVTIASDDAQVTAHKRKRKFKRRFMQPQLKRKRKTVRNFEEILDQAAFEGWNGILKNISGHPCDNTEYALFSKGKQFAPVELDPPIIRMQRELNRFYRILRIKWEFYEKPDTRSELERKFYQKSDWEPPKASVEIENFITDIQHKFDTWKPP